MAAKSLATTTDTAHHFCFIPNTNLPQFNPHLEYASQILDQFAKIQPGRLR